MALIQLVLNGKKISSTLGLLSLIIFKEKIHIPIANGGATTKVARLPAHSAPIIKTLDKPKTMEIIKTTILPVIAKPHLPFKEA